MRSGRSQRAVARAHRMSLATVQLWIARAGTASLDAVDFADRSSAPRRTRRTDAAVEDIIVDTRRRLGTESILGEAGAAAIRRELDGRTDLGGPVPALRTIGRILERRGLLDRRRRLRHPAPPSGWYLPDVAAGLAELDSVDVIEGLRIAQGPMVEVLTAVSLHGGLVAAWPGAAASSRTTVERLTEHWQAVGRPGYAQFDNDTRFHGSHGHANVLGPVVRLCLELAVVPVFVPPREHGFQAAIESFNGRWQAKVWTRVRATSLAQLEAASAGYVRAHRARSAARIEAAPARPGLPRDWQPDLRRPSRGRLVFLRRTSESGRVTVLGRAYPVDPRWPHRLVRGELDLGHGELRFFALRRREPTDQPLLAIVPYEPSTVRTG